MLCTGTLIVGLLVLLVLTELALRVVGGLATVVGETAGELPPKGEAVRVLCLGDSMTSFGDEQAYPYQLESLLEKRLPERDFHVSVVASPGLDTAALLHGLDPKLSRFEPDIVTAMVGVNDHRPWFVDMNHESVTGERLGWFGKTKLYRLWVLSRHAHLEREHQRDQERLHEEREARLAAKALESNDSRALLRLARHQLTAGERDRARETILKVLAKRDSSEAWMTLAKATDDPTERCRLYRQVLERYPGHHDSYQWPFTQARFQLAIPQSQTTCPFDLEALLQQQIEQLPDAMSYNDLGMYLQSTGRAQEAIEAFQRSDAAQPNSYADLALGKLYHGEGEVELARHHLQASIDRSPSVRASLALGLLEEQSGRLEAAKRAYRSAASLRPPPSHQPVGLRLYRDLDPSRGTVELARLLREQGEHQEAERVSEILTTKLGQHEQFVHLVERIQERGGRVAILQYPRRSTATLEVVLAEMEDTIVVSNVENFEQALEAGGWSSVFVDESGGDFGHLTPAGHALVARAAADAIVEGWFAQSGG